MSITAALFNRVVVFFFFRVGLCSHTALTYAGRVAARGASDAGGTVEITWTRVHAITDQSMCVNRSLK